MNCVVIIVSFGIIVLYIMYLVIVVETSCISTLLLSSFVDTSCVPTLLLFILTLLLVCCQFDLDLRCYYFAFGLTLLLFCSPFRYYYCCYYGDFALVAGTSIPTFVSSVVVDGITCRG